MINWIDIVENFDYLMKGLNLTLKIATVSIVTSLFLGVILGVLRHSKIFPLNYLATAFIELIRSIPLILFIMFVHFGFLPALYGKTASVFQSSYISLSIFSSVYIAEIIRGGLKSIEKSHIDAARSLGLNYFQRLFYIILPLAISRMTPAIVSQFISLIKDTSLASTIGLIELTRAGEIVYERTFHEFEILIFIAIFYFLICYGLSLISRKMESKAYILSIPSKLIQTN